MRVNLQAQGVVLGNQEEMVAVEAFVVEVMVVEEVVLET